ncbi:MAG TPA: phosphatase PAP2 family protein [Nocardioidaceae bacterium]|nr:phosphatase PAP2 family protein [Nocardioidaceae bacterium]
MSATARTAPAEVSAQLMPAVGPPTPTRRMLGRLGIELAWVVGMLGLYNVGRYIAKQHVAPAFDNAMQLWDFERWMKIPSEQTLQATVLNAWPWGIEMANRYYATVHFPLTLAFLVWMFLRRPDHYLWIRRSLVILTCAALVGHLAFPLAPPRMLPQLGFVDTGVLFNMSVYGADGANSIANQYAAMPSLHVAWAALVAVGLITSTRTRWRWFWMIHPALTLAVVVVTANHYWLDGIIGLLLLIIALTVTVRARPEPDAEDAEEPADDAPVDTPAKAPGTPETPEVAAPAPARVGAGVSRSALADTPSDTLDTPELRP